MTNLGEDGSRAVLGCEFWVVGCGLYVVGCGVWGVGCGLWVLGCGVWVVDVIEHGSQRAGSL